MGFIFFLLLHLGYICWLTNNKSIRYLLKMNTYLISLKSSVAKPKLFIFGSGSSSSYSTAIYWHLKLF